MILLIVKPFYSRGHNIHTKSFLKMDLKIMSCMLQAHEQNMFFSIPDEELFSEMAVGCTASYFVKFVLCSRWFCNFPHILRLCINALIAVAEGWLLLNIG